MRFVFVDPPSPPGFVAFRHSHGGYGEMCRTSRLKFPTLDLFHAASLLLDHGFKAAVVDSVLEDHSPAACVKAVLAHKPTHVVFRTASGSSAHDLEVARLLKYEFSGPVIFYGPQTSVEPGRLLAGGADAVFEGEAAPLFLELARKGGPVPRRAKAPPMRDLDSLPVPRWDLVDYKRYSYVTSQTSWGCPFRCGYCPYPVTQGTQWRTRSNASVVREFQELRDRYGLRFVLLRDPEFTLRRDRTVSLCRALIKAGTPMLWGCETRLDTLDEELVGLMAKAGCMRVAFGVDSVNASTLSAMGRRPGTLKRIRASVAALKRHGMLTYGMYIVGLPQETESSTRRLIDFALELDTDAASFSMATPFPGTRLEKTGRERGWIKARDPLNLTGCVPSMRNGAMTIKDVERLYRLAKTEWKRKQDSAPRRRASALSSPL